jgi:hypothetical protein
MGRTRRRRKEGKRKERGNSASPFLLSPLLFPSPSGIYGSGGAAREEPK